MLDKKHLYKRSKISRKSSKFGLKTLNCKLWKNHLKRANSRLMFNCLPAVFSSTDRNLQWEFHLNRIYSLDHTTTVWLPFLVNKRRTQVRCKIAQMEFEQLSLFVKNHRMLSGETICIQWKIRIIWPRLFGQIFDLSLFLFVAAWKSLRFQLHIFFELPEVLNFNWASLVRRSALEVSQL